MTLTTVHASDVAPNGKDRSRHRRRITGLIVGVLLLGVLVVLSLAIGTRGVPPHDVWSALVHPSGTENDTVVRDLRVPRTLLAIAAGAGLGLAGGVMQAVTRNPLADPGLLGVHSGAAAAVITAIAVLGITSFTGYLWFALAGAALATVLVSLLGGLRGATPARLTLAGVSVNAALLGYVNCIQLLDLSTLDAMRHWSVGTVDGRSLSVLAQALPTLVIGMVLALMLGGPLRILGLGDDSARSLGVNPMAIRTGSVIAITLLCGTVTAVCGPIAFVGLMIPHAVRLFVGADTRWVLPYCALFAPSLLLASDIIGRVIARPSEIEVGIVTAVLGGVIFIYLVRHLKVVAL